jgi:hypothetical protein
MTKHLQEHMKMKLVLLEQGLVKVLLGLALGLELHCNLEFHFVVLNHRPNQ